MQLITAKPGEKFEVEFKAAENSGVMATAKINGKISFPNRQGQQPKAGDIWEVETAGTNPAGSVHFLKCIRFVSNPEMRRAASDVAQANRENQRKLDIAVIESRLAEIKVALVLLMPIGYQQTVALTGALEGFSVSGSSIKKVEITNIDSETGVEATIVQSLNIHFGTGRVDIDLEFSHSGWKSVMLSDWHEVNLATRTMTPGMTLAGRSKLGLNYPAQVSKVYWEKDEATTYQGGQTVRIPRYTVKQIITATTPLGEATRTEVVWQSEPRSDSFYPSWDETQMALMLAEIEAEKAKIEAGAMSLKNAGLLMMSNGNGWSTLKEAGVPGIAWATQGESTCAIDPALAVVFASSDFKMVPLVMKDVPEGIDPWTKISWPNGREVDLAKVEAFMSNTQSEQKTLSEEEFEVWVAENTSAIQVEIFASNSTGSDNFTYQARFQMPFKIVEFHDFGGNYRIVRSSRIEMREATIKEAGYGNREFVGILPATLGYKYSGYHETRVNSVYFVNFEIPKTEEEVASLDDKAWEEFVKWAKEGQIVLAGWRYEDTGNPAVYFAQKQQYTDHVYFYMRELVIEEGKAPEIVYRKGCKKGDLPGAFSREAVIQAMALYSERGWPMVEDKSLPFGQKLLKFLGFEEEG